MLPRIPWDATPATMQRFAPGTFDPDNLEWELYHLDEDFTQADNLAERYPDKVRELSAAWWEEAGKYNVLPLLGGMSAYFGIVPPLGTRHTFTYWGADVQNVHEGIMPPIKNRSYSITADLVVPEGGAEGVIVAAFDELGGFSLFVKDGTLRHTYSFMGVAVYKQESAAALPSGKVRVKLDFEAEAPVLAPGGTVRLFVNDEEVGSGRMERTVPLVFTAYAGMDIGRDNGQVVDRSYLHRAPFPFTGTIEKVVFDVRPPGTAAQLQAVHQAQTAGQQAKHIDA
jgi:arylsulfatase